MNNIAGNLVGHNAYSMGCAGELIGESESPLCDGARIVLAGGLVQPEDRIATARNGVVAMTAGVRWASEHRAGAAGWTRWAPHPMAVSRAPTSLETAI